MPGQIPGVGGGPVFQPNGPPPFTPPFGPGSSAPQNTGNSSGGGAASKSGSTADGTHTNPGSSDAEEVRRYWIAWGSPANGSAQGHTTFSVTVTPTSWDSSTLSLQVEWSTSPDFSTGYGQTTLTGQASAAPVNVSVGPVTDISNVYMRARAGLGEVWSEWTSTVYVKVDTRVGASTEYILLNVGVTLVQYQGNTEYLLENVGFNLTQYQGDVGYVMEGEVNADQPDPRIWTIRPDTGRAGDGVKVYGMGFGSTAGTYSGIVQVLINGTWTTMSVTDWQLVAANADAYNDNRTLDPDTPHIDMEHNEVTFSIPNTATPPGHPVRVRTVGP